MDGKRLVLNTDGQIQVESFAVTPPTAHQIVIQMSYSQISAGTELNIIRQYRQLSPEKRRQDPAPYLGYTAVGRIVACGEAVTDWTVGERVLCYGHHWSHWTVNLDHAGMDRDIIPNPNLVERVPEVLTDTEAAFAVLGDVALHGVRRAAIQIGESVAVHGLGTVGLLSLQLARLAGAYPVIGIDVVESRLEMALEFGATHVINADDPNLVDKIHELTELEHTWKGWIPGLKPGTGAEVQLQASSNIQTYETMLRAAADRGRLILLGIAQDTVAIGSHELLRRELTVFGSYQTGQQAPHPYWPWDRARNRAIILDLIARGELQVQPMISHMVSSDAAATVYNILDEGSGDDWLSVFLRWS